MIKLLSDLSETYEILVLASLDRVVDLLNIHDGCVSCLLWNYDGTMLGKNFKFTYRIQN